MVDQPDTTYGCDMLQHDIVDRWQAVYFSCYISLHFATPNAQAFSFST